MNHREASSDSDFEPLLQLAARLLQAPVAVLTVMEQGLPKAVAATGLTLDVARHARAFSRHAVDLGATLVVTETLQDPRFAANPLVASDEAVRFYAGAPMVSPDGVALGTLAIMDRTPRALTPLQSDTLEGLAQQALWLLLQRRRHLLLEQDARKREQVGAMALQKSRSLLQIAGRMARIGGWELALPDGPLLWSDEIAAIHDMPPGSTPSLEECLDFYTLQHRPRVVAALNACVTDGIAYDEEWQIVTATGRRVWCRAIGQAIRGEDGRIERVEGVFQDISERRAVDDAARASEERFRMVARATADAVWDWTFDDNRIWWSEGMQTLFGFAPAALDPDASSWSSRIHPDDRQRVESGIHGAIEGTAQSWSDEYRFLRADGSYAYVLDRGHVIRNDEGAAIRMVGGMTDLSMRKAAEEQVRMDAETRAGIVRVQQEVVAGNLDQQQIMNLMAERAQVLTNADGGSVEMVEGDELVCVASAGANPLPLGFRFARNGSLSGAAVAQGAGMLSEHTPDDPRVSADICRALGVGSMVVVPLRVADRIVGVLCAVARASFHFGQRDLNNLQILVESLGAALQRHQAAQQILASEAQYRLLFNNNPHPMWVHDSETLQLLAVNRSTVATYGYSEAELLSMTIRELRPPEDIPLLEKVMAHTAPDAKYFGRWRHRKRDGSLFDVDVSTDGIDFNGRPARLLMVADVTERLRVERELARVSRAQKMLSACNEALIRAEHELPLLQEICRITVEIGGYRVGYVGFALNDEGRTILPVAHAGKDADAYLKRLSLTWDENQPFGRGPSGRAIRSGRVQIIEDIAADADFAPWMQLAGEIGYRGIVSLPLIDRQSTFGVLVLLASEVAHFSGDELELLRELANDLAFGIGNLRAQQEQRRLQTAVLAVAASVSAVASTAFFEQLARNMAAALDGCAGFVVRGTPGSGVARTLAAVIDDALVPNFDYPVQAMPCAGLAGALELVVPDHVGKLYPEAPLLGEIGARAYVGRRLDNSAGEAVGWLFVLLREPLRQSALITSTLQIFAGRAASELERQDADNRIREQASLLDKAKDAILVRGIDHRIQFWSKGAERLYGWRADEVEGRSIETLLYAADPTTFRSATDAVLMQGEWTGEIKQQCRDGSNLTVEGHWTLVRDDAGHPHSILAINTDISKRLAMEQQLQQSQRLEAVGQLTGGVAHDFNNLLTVILGNSELLVEQLADNPRQRMLAEMMQTAAQRGADLTHRLLAFARRQALEPKAVDANRLVADMEGLLRRALREDIEIEFVRGAGLWPALVDPAQLEGALLNLSINARDAIEAAGLLTIETANVRLDEEYAARHDEVQAGQYVMVAVSDTGHGIAAENLSRIFEPFFTTKAFGKGTGLGLSMVYGFIKQSRGHIKVYSEIGQGTSIKMYLPRADRTEEAPRQWTQSLAGLRGNERILLVEDDDLVRAYAQDQLAELGYRVVAVHNGPEAMAVLAEDGVFDLLFTDVVMPGGMNGRQLAEAARALRPDLKVLYTSGYTENAIVHHGRLDRGVHLLHKPYPRLELARKVRAALA